jgi:hypothetical protein
MNLRVSLFWLAAGQRAAAFDPMICSLQPLSESVGQGVVQADFEFALLIIFPTSKISYAVQF